MSLGLSAQAKCIECSTRFPTDQLIRHGEYFVCAGCKPIFIQKLAEGADIYVRKMRYAGFWRRFAAYIVDSLVVGFMLALVNVVVQGMLAPVLATLVMGALGAAYEIVLITRYGTTVGKILFKMSVVTPNGGEISYARSIGRYFSKLLSALILAVGYIMVGFDSEKRGLHDRLANTRVVIG